MRDNIRHIDLVGSLVSKEHLSALLLDTNFPRRRNGWPELLFMPVIAPHSNSWGHPDTTILIL